ncbi:MAG: SDR family oxidoreductase [Chloroflexi bacterium]|nr:SDR family oxidoreductase [Chloroflexota bacterium]
MSDPTAPRVVVVTGSARGLGLGMIRRFAAEGDTVVVTDIDREAGEAAASSLRHDGAAADYVDLDVRDPARVEAVVETLVADHGHIDVWVNNAGVAHKGPAESLSLADWDESVAVMLSGAFYCAQAVGRGMLARGTGVIVNVASVNAYMPIEGRVAYSVAKAGLVSLTEALGIEWASRGVRVVGVAPGVVMTDLVAAGIAAGTASAETYQRRTPMHRLGEIDEVAEAVAFLASPAASYIVGETLRVDGGWTAYQLF